MIFRVKMAKSIVRFRKARVFGLDAGLFVGVLVVAMLGLFFGALLVVAIAGWVIDAFLMGGSR